MAHHVKEDGIDGELDMSDLFSGDDMDHGDGKMLERR
jgi:hypothetical protein